MKAEALYLIGIGMVVVLASIAGTVTVLGLLNLAGPRYVYLVVRWCLLSGLGFWTVLVLPAFVALETQRREVSS